MKNPIENDAVLLLQDGTRYFGKGFGKASTVVGEAVFMVNPLVLMGKLLAKSFLILVWLDILNH